MSFVRSLVEWLQASPVGSHLLRSFFRYLNRLGNQLSAAMAFFTVLALVPVLMFAFAAVGFTLTVLRPDLLGAVQIFIVDNLSAGPVQDQILILLGQYLLNWRRVSILATVVALVVGTSWVANLKGVIRGMGRPSFDMMQVRRPWQEPLINMGLLLVILVLVATTFAATVVGTQLAGTIVGWLHVSSLEVDISSGMLRLISLSFSLAGATLLFWLMYRFLPDERPPSVALRRGSVGAAVCFVVLQTAASWITGLLSLGRATQLFGPVIVAMLFINFFANLILFWAAWIATSNQPAVARRHSPGDEILRNRENVQTVTDHWRVADAQVEAQLEADRSASHPGVRLPHLNKRRPTVARVRRGASPVGRRDDQR
ncbi:YhjD/YihY/BrkB family envelope integrity protein [Brooklawnia sp.]|uniref:YhjD/YihY/BrkB family envelope integrity protein n=1 Tax=Brooklawnia sp. TaxID=2699740 RepID=UPI00311F6D54